MIKTLLSICALFIAFNIYADDLRDSSGLQLNVTLEKNVFKSGEPFIAHLEFANAGQKNIGLNVSPNSVGISVYDESGEKIIAQTCDMNSMVMAFLGPEDKYGGISIDLKDQLPVLSGKYTIQLGYAMKSDMSGGIQFGDTDQWKGMIQSEKIEVEVVE